MSIEIGFVIIMVGLSIVGLGFSITMTSLIGLCVVFVDGNVSENTQLTVKIFRVMGLLAVLLILSGIWILTIGVVFYSYSK